MQARTLLIVAVFAAAPLLAGCASEPKPLIRREPLAGYKTGNRVVITQSTPASERKVRDKFEKEGVQVVNTQRR